MQPAPAAFLLIKSNRDAYATAQQLRAEPHVRWASAVYGPHQVVACAEAETPAALAGFIEQLRPQPAIAELDARICKPIPGDETLAPLQVTQPVAAVLLVNVNYREEKERVVTVNLRQLPAVRLARAMWGPADIIAVVQAPDHEALRNVICDEIKILKGVAANTTLYCYPETTPTS